MRDIIVTTPKSEIQNAAREAEECKQDGGGFYFRRLWRLPRGVEAGSKVFYVEDGYIRGYAVVSDIKRGPYRCQTTGRNWGPGFYLFMDAKSWQWIRAIPMRGFQGIRFFDGEYVVVGDWLDPKPEV